MVDQTPIKSTSKSLSDLYRIQNSKNEESPNKKISKIGNLLNNSTTHPNKWRLQNNHKVPLIEL